MTAAEERDCPELALPVPYLHPKVSRIRHRGDALRFTEWIPGSTQFASLAASPQDDEIQRASLAPLHLGEIIRLDRCVFPQPLQLGVPDTNLRQFIEETDRGGSSARIFWDTYLGFFVQDEWRASAQLTLSFGIRYERESIPR